MIGILQPLMDFTRRGLGCGGVGREVHVEMEE